LLQLLPSDLLSQNEIDAASLLHLDQFNAQVQEPFTWPASFAVARAYVDQLARGSSLATNEIADVRRDLDAAERVSGTPRRAALTRLATRVDGLPKGGPDEARVRALVASIRKLALSS